jgi:hypothetical protein
MPRFNVQWKQRSLRQVSKALRSGNWRASQFYTEVGTAHYWNRKPSELGLCEPGEDAAVMLSYYQTTKTMEAYDQHLQNREIEKMNRKAKRK